MSYSPVFSQGFIYYSSSTPNTEFDVPVGFTAVVREIDVYTEVGGIDANAAVRSSPEAPWVYFAGLDGIAINGSAQWTGRVVVPGGGSIGLGVGQLGVNDTAYCGGYLLRNVVS